jgi:putative colanic acid biosynthesis acetyltransferase WcaF
MQQPPLIDLSRYDQSWFSRGRPAWMIVLWDLTWLFLIRPSPQPLYGWRRFWWRMFGARIGRNVLIRSTVRCNYPWKVSIGDHTWIGEEVWIYALDHIDIGAHVVISQQAYLCTGSHDISDPCFGLRTKPIAIHDNAWITLGALIMPGVTIGTGAVISARSILTHDAHSWTIYRGSPAVAIGTRSLTNRTITDPL